MLAKIILDDKAKLHALLSLILLLVVFLLNLNWKVFLSLSFVFNLYLMSLDFSFTVFRSLDQANIAKPMIPLKVIISAMRAIVTAFLMFLCLKYFSLDYVQVLLASFSLLASLIISGFYSNQYN